MATEKRWQLVRLWECALRGGGGQLQQLGTQLSTDKCTVHTSELQWTVYAVQCTPLRCIQQFTVHPSVLYCTTYSTPLLTALSVQCTNPRCTKCIVFTYILHWTVHSTNLCTALHSVQYTYLYSADQRAHPPSQCSALQCTMEVQHVACGRVVISLTICLTLHWTEHWVHCVLCSALYTALYTAH